MTTKMTGAEIAATRHLLGLSPTDLAYQLGVSRQSVKDWERGRFTAREGVVGDLYARRAAHDAETARLIHGAQDGVPIGLLSGPKPRGWYLALGARVLDAVPDAMLEWAEDLGVA
ncbi:helix-turn-helix domain-containing protein [Microbacterium sp.]|uniref:helix-turn-helix domain-containing protein n=1 Tax=Microbacterium sp. TaxID=51671 RepID=UPI002621D9E4|nr:helix-turn-helix domain-containing protein [Microbacterium sp.]